MPSYILRGESLFIPFRNGKSISDSQCKPRMYKNLQNFEKAFPFHNKGRENIEMVEYAEVKHGEWEIKSEIHRFFEEVDEEFYVECPFCHRVYWVPFEFEDEKMLKYAKENYPYCNCGAKMDGRSDSE